MRPMPSLPVSSTRPCAISSACARLSIWHGPANRGRGRSLPIVTLPTWMWRGFVAFVGVVMLAPMRMLSNQAGLVERGADERREERVRLERLRFQLGMELYADEPGVAGELDDLGQFAIGRHAGEEQALVLEPGLVVDIDLVAVAMALADIGRAVDLAHPAAWREDRPIGAEPHRAAEIATGFTALQEIAANPLRHQPDHRLTARAELGRAGLRQISEIARRLDDRHLHAEADAEIGHRPLACEARRLDLALGAALAEAAWHQDAVDALEVLYGVFLLEDLRIEPIELDPDIIGDAAMGQRLGERFVAVE